jgi:hypothetical protein
LLRGSAARICFGVALLKSGLIDAFTSRFFSLVSEEGSEMDLFLFTGFFLTLDDDDMKLLANRKYQLLRTTKTMMIRAERNSENKE